MRKITEYDLVDGFIKGRIWEDSVFFHFKNTKKWQESFDLLAQFMLDEAQQISQLGKLTKKTYSRLRDLIALSKYMLIYWEILIDEIKPDSARLETLKFLMSEKFGLVKDEISGNQKIIDLIRSYKSDDAKQSRINSFWIDHFFNKEDLSPTKKRWKDELGRNIALIGEGSAQKLFVPSDRKSCLKGVCKNLLTHSSIKKGFLFNLSEDATYDLLLSKDKKFRRKVFNKSLIPSKEGEQTVFNIFKLKHELSQASGKDNYVELAAEKNFLDSKEKILEFLNGIAPKIRKDFNKLNKEIAAKKEEDYIFCRNQFLWKKHKGCGDYPLKKTVSKIFDYLEEHLDITIGFEKVNSCLWLLTLKDGKKKGFIFVSPFDYKNRGLSHQCDLLKSFKSGNLTIPSVQFVNLQFSNPKTLSFRDVEVFMHEMGHALHFFFSDTKDPLCKELNLPWDLCETPSVYMEKLVSTEDFYTKVLNETSKTLPVSKEAEVIHKYELLEKSFSKIEAFGQSPRKNIARKMMRDLRKKKVIYNPCEDYWLKYIDPHNDGSTTLYAYLYSELLAQKWIESGKKMKEILRDIVNKGSGWDAFSLI